MRFLASILATVVALGLVNVSQANAHGWKKKHRHVGKRVVRQFTQREIDTLPVRVTRPDNSSNLLYDGYPLWAARAFQPSQKR